MIDRDTVSTAAARVIGALCSAFVAAAIVLYLDPATQGYWYTFSSILGLATFAELGAGQIIMRFVAAEVGAGGQEQASLERLHGMLRFAFRYGLMMSVIAVGAVSAAGGLWIASSHSDLPTWKAAWLVASVGALLIMFNGFLFSYFEGWQLIAKVNLVKITVSLVTTGLTLVGLSIGAGLLAFGVSRVAAAVTALGLCVFLFRHHLENLLTVSAICDSIWKSEFYALQKRYAMTWLTGIFVTSIYLPVIFRVCGAVDSGKFGMSQAFINVIIMVASALVGGKQARMAALAGHNIFEAKALFGKIQSRSAGLYIFLCLLAFGAVEIGERLVPGFKFRLLSTYELVGLMAAGFFWVLILNYTTFVRSFGREPFVRIAWTHAIICAVCLFPVTKSYGTAGAVVLSLVGNMIIALAVRRIALGHLLQSI